MVLPSIVLPEYKVKMLSSDREITIRPFTVREEKILLMAAESNSSKEIINAVRQIIINCIVNKDINIDDLDFYELIYIYLQIKKVSSGEELKSKVITDDGEYEAICNLDKDIVIDDLNKLDDFSKPIKISNNNIYIEIRPMRFKDYVKLISMFDIDNEDRVNENKVEFLYTSLLMTIDKIYTDTESFDPKDYTVKELRDFYESFPQSDKIKIQEKFNSLPKVALKYHYRDKNGKQCEKVLDKVDFNFFG